MAFSRTARRWLPVLTLLFLAFPSEAHAHSSFKGAGDFINGLLHPLTTPTHILIIVALGLLAGQKSPLTLKLPMLIFGPLAALALLLTTTQIVKTVFPPFLILIALCAAIFVALEKHPPPLWYGAVFAVAALGMGFDSGVETGTAAAIAKTLVGTWISLGVLICDIAIYVSLCTRKQWQKIGVRIVGSWIIAISLMMLAFALKK